MPFWSTLHSSLQFLLVAARPTFAMTIIRLPRRRCFSCFCPWFVITTIFEARLNNKCPIRTVNVCFFFGNVKSLELTGEVPQVRRSDFDDT
uniref:Secreted protein n=1 Tax=Bursaphelenchus xylophilus TaxID=6326 RepID=A0A1I7SKV6_BURXY